MKYSHIGTLRLFISICVAVISLVFPILAYEDVSDEALKAIPRPGKDFDIHDGAILSPILIPRVAGTPGSAAVLNHFADFFRDSLPSWSVEYQNSTSVTPVSDGKEVPFSNFIAYRDPPFASKGDVGRLTLVAHYDSKYEPEGFIGAIDSAAPCAIIMHAMRSIDDALTKKWESMKATHGHSLDDHVGIQVIFLDGEEAFKYWTATDSLYGSRSLAQQWDSEVNPAMSIYKTPLSSISLFVLLDLLGSKDPIIGSFFPTTHWAYQKLANVERRLRDLGLFKSGGKTWFLDASKSEQEISPSDPVADDHIPFLKRGVEVMHVVDYSQNRNHVFPEVWHTPEDDGEHLDMDTVEDWSVLIAGFAAEWMELESFLPAVKEKKRSPGKTEL
ncbi:hypothetical protein BDV19DRAFT_360469 [Aspergillus venezuelensis]